MKTEKTYKDFHAFLRFKCETPNNSGFSYHSDIEEDISKTRFIQVEISSRVGGHTGGLHGDHTAETKGRDWIVWPAPELETVLRAFDWAATSQRRYSASRSIANRRVPGIRFA